MISSYAKMGKIDSAFQAYEEFIAAAEKDPELESTPSINYAILTLHVKNNDLEAADKFLQKLLDENNPKYEISQKYFNALMEAYVDNPVKILEYFNSMIQLKLKPNIVSYRFLILSQGLAGDLQSVLGTYNDLIAQGLQPNSHLISTLINVHALNNDFKGAASWYERLKERGIVPSSVDIKEMMNISLIEKKFEDSLNYYKEAFKIWRVDHSVFNKFILTHLLSGKGFQKVYMLAENQRSLLKNHLYSKNDFHVVIDSILDPKTLFHKYCRVKSGVVADPETLSDHVCSPSPGLKEFELFLQNFVLNESERLLAEKAKALLY